MHLVELLQMVFIFILVAVFIDCVDLLLQRDKSIDFIKISISILFIVSFAVTIRGILSAIDLKTGMSMKLLTAVYTPFNPLSAYNTVIYVSTSNGLCFYRHKGMSWLQQRFAFFFTLRLPSTVWASPTVTTTKNLVLHKIAKIHESFFVVSNCSRTVFVC